MGYCIDVCGDLAIREENIPVAIDCLKELMKGISEKGGGSSYRGGECLERFFSWVNTERVIVHLETNNLYGALREWRYDFVENQSNVEFNYFLGEKWGDDEYLWQALAPAIDSGSVIEYCGEDGHRWRYLFEDNGVKEQNAVITWE